MADAHGGVLYVDEVNLLPDHLVDVLLDVAASGVNRVEREGISHSHPSRFVLIGSMNPEEGDLRPQLLDRFGLAVDVRAPVAPAVRAEAVRRRLAFDADPVAVAASWAGQETRVGDSPGRRLTGGAARGTGRAGEPVVCCGRSAGPAGRPHHLPGGGRPGRVRGPSGGDSRGHTARSRPLALAHRRRRGPFDSPGIDDDELQQAMKEASETGGAGADGAGAGGAGAGGAGADAGDGAEAGADSGADVGSTAGRVGHERDQVVAPGGPTAIVRLVVPSSGASVTTPAPGRRTTVEGPRGHLVADRIPDGPIRSVAVGATIRAAAVRRAEARSVEGPDSASASADPASASADPASAESPVLAADLREAVREQRAGNLIVLAVDASGSMGADRRMEAAKGAVLSLLLDAYQRRDKVAMVTFRGDAAEVVLKPTSSVEVARARLAELPTGGRTPLAAGILAALDLATAPGRSAAHRPLLVLFTDGRATSGATITEGSSVRGP